MNKRYLMFKSLVMSFDTIENVNWVTTLYNNGYKLISYPTGDKVLQLVKKVNNDSYYKIVEVAL